MDKSTKNTLFSKLNIRSVARKYQEIRKKSGQKVLVFLFFVALSALIWFFNALGKDYSTFISFPVRYINFPKGKVLMNDVPGRLLLKVNAKGNTIFKYKMRSNINPVVFDVQSFAPKQLSEASQGKFHVLTSLARERLQGQLNQEIQITDIEPDTLFFEFASTESKRVPVTANVSVNLEKQYMQKGNIQVKPDSVSITGPSTVIDSIHSVSTKPYQFKNINDSVSKSVNLQKSDNLEYSIDEVQITIFAERFTESDIDIPVRVNNLPDSIQLKTFPRQVKVTFRVGLSDYEKISPEMFRVAVNFDSTLLLKPPKKLDVRIEKYPGFITSVNHNPTSVDYILER